MGQLASQLFHGQVCVIPSLSQLQWADKRSRVHFKCAICIWNLLLSTVKMRSKELSLSVKQAIIRLKKQNKPIREIAKTLGVAKTTVWNILKRRNAPVSSATPKDPEDHGKQLWWMTEEFFPGEENTLHNSWPDQEHSPGGRCMCVKVNNQEKTSPSEYRGFTTRCKPLVSLKNRKARLEFAKRHLKKPSQFWNNILWQMRPRSTLYQSDGKRRVWRRKGIAHDPKHTTSSVKHGGGSVMAWACMPASGTGSLVFYWWCDCWQKQQDEFWSVSGNIICSYSAKCFRTHWTALHSADGQWPKAYCKSNQRVFEGKEVDCYAMAKSITWPESDWACIHLLKTKLKGKCPKNKQELKTVAVEAWQSITRDETQRLVMSMRSRLQAVIDCKGFATKY